MSYRKGSLLLIEDTPFEGASLKEEIASHGYDVEWVENSESASAEIERGVQYQGIIADIHLGVLENSLGVAFEAIRKQPLSYIVCVTGVQNSPLMDEARKICDYFTDKPIDVQDIIGRIERGHQEKKRIMREILQDLNGNSADKSKAQPDENISAFIRERESLLKDHEGKFVAFVDGKLAGIGIDKDDLFAEVYEKTGKSGMLITKLSKESRLHRNISLRRRS